MAARTGKEQRRNSKVARNRTPNLSGFFAKTKTPMGLENAIYQIVLHRKKQHPLNLRPIVESIDWDDSGGGMNGTVALRRHGKADSIPVKRGHELSCIIKVGSKTNELWRMRVEAVDVDVAGIVSVTVKDALSLLTHTRRDWSFRKVGKHKKRGWYAHEIAQEVAKREGIKLGRIAKGTHKIDKIVKKNTNALSILAAAYSEETDATGVKYIARFVNGRLEITAFQKNKVIYTLAKLIQSAQIIEEGSDHPATSVTAEGRVGKGKDARKRKYTAIDREVAARFGFKHRTIKMGKVSSYDVLRRKAKKELAKGLKAKKTITLSHTAIPFIRRGDACRVLISSDGLKGKDAFVFVTSVSYSISGSARTMALELNTVDPYEADRKRRAKDKKKREKKRKAKAAK